MLLDDLISVIETLKERLRTHQSVLQGNETRTRMALIDPLLSALGWDTADPSVVTAEYAAKEGRADYALLGPDGTPAAFIEAKRLGESLEPHRMQMLNYSNALGIEYAGLTDGDHWELYDVFSRRTLEDRRHLDLRLADSPAHECALKLLLLWRPNLASGRPIPATSPIQGPLRLDPGTTWIPLSEFDPPSGTPPPSEMRLPNGDIRPMKHWYELLVHTTEWLWSQRRLTLDDVPVPSSRKSYLINIEPVHQDGTRFSRQELVPSTPLILSTNRNGAQCRSGASMLLTRFGEGPATVGFRPSP